MSRGSPSGWSPLLHSLLALGLTWHCWIPAAVSKPARLHPSTAQLARDWHLLWKPTHVSRGCVRHHRLRGGGESGVLLVLEELLGCW